MGRRIVPPLAAHAGVAATAALAEIDKPDGGRTADSLPPPSWSQAGSAHAIEVARVLARDGSEVLVEIDGRQVMAWIAIPPPATIDAGDLVVVIGGAPRWWAVGTLAGLSGPGDAAPPAFTAATDLRLCAPRGRITLAAARSWIGGGAASIAASTLRSRAQSCVLRCQTANQWVTGCVSRMLGSVFQRVTGDYHRRSRSVDSRAEGPVTIKGSGIRLN